MEKRFYFLFHGMLTKHNVVITNALNIYMQNAEMVTLRSLMPPQVGSASLILFRVINDD